MHMKTRELTMFEYTIHTNVGVFVGYSTLSNFSDLMSKDGYIGLWKCSDSEVEGLVLVKSDNVIACESKTVTLKKLVACMD